MKMSYGLYVICDLEDEAPEPEGMVIFNTLHPPIGTEVVLSDKKTWIVTEDNIEDPFNPHIVVRRKCSSKSNNSTKLNKGGSAGT